MRRDDMSLDRLLADPLIRLVMKSDGVVEGDILALARRHRAQRPPRPAAFAGAASLEHRLPYPMMA